jgi:hypothetical protein
MDGIVTPGADSCVVHDRSRLVTFLSCATKAPLSSAQSFAPLSRERSHFDLKTGDLSDSIYRTPSCYSFESREGTMARSEG